MAEANRRDEAAYGETGLGPRGPLDGLRTSLRDAHCEVLLFVFNGIAAIAGVPLSPVVHVSYLCHEMAQSRPRVRWAGVCANVVPTVGWGMGPTAS